MLLTSLIQEIYIIIMKEANIYRNTSLRIQRRISDVILKNMLPNTLLDVYHIMSNLCILDLRTQRVCIDGHLILN